MSARARFLVPRLWDVKMEGLGVLEGRGRPWLVLLGGFARREERVDVKTGLEGGGGLEVLDCGTL